MHPLLHVLALLTIMVVVWETLRFVSAVCNDQECDASTFKDPRRPECDFDLYFMGGDSELDRIHLLRHILGGTVGGGGITQEEFDAFRAQVYPDTGRSRLPPPPQSAFYCAIPYHYYRTLPDGRIAVIDSR